MMEFCPRSRRMLFLGISGIFPDLTLIHDKVKIVSVYIHLHTQFQKIGIESPCWIQRSKIVIL